LKKIREPMVLTLSYFIWYWLCTCQK